ncbi:predicted protein [Sclerotinia sclerotiorum 1980 UF-70]|uniref:Uncharacterized protein n=1 Tax=Sclerotinia sclerotiorum (strain ATCC 18683 / 1980 / Ss-1) TaxID=665079 RepID=A7EXM9_SCLS1|nr:predicted protein [Sclerotinia sclerotiorum 1980 UF-70]EDN94221.1 predicted protein [Sclerotinia sclerotiorum 1980 UF-70]
MCAQLRAPFRAFFFGKRKTGVGKHSSEICLRELSLEKLSHCVHNDRNMSEMVPSQSNCLSTRKTSVILAKVTYPVIFGLSTLSHLLRSQCSLMSLTIFPPTLGYRF